MTRKDSVRAASGTAKGSVLHAAEAVGPKVGLAARQAQHTAREQYENVVAPRLSHARSSLPPAVDDAASRAAERTRAAAKSAAAYTTPRVEAARAAAGPARDEALGRSVAALAALRGEITAAEVKKLNKKRTRRARNGRAFKRVLVLGLLGGAAMAAWRWWDQQANPDWLVEPPAPTDVTERSALSTVDGAPEDAASLDPEVQAKQADADTGPDGGKDESQG
ncbi:DUF5324 family protein [Streptomyces sp. TRM 70351]|uniref:DUF5324 family protein n=1 Tax=Streptomyces sp. TRM 70351 TaxID=3116552 RepID=UPI002E7B6B5D|nr:DUF5324 family protein [Streptomyces sp. TRM 70351]MEE1930044.1 DUF5324 family protein [Streptomyces sp. TRM 70351]